MKLKYLLSAAVIVTATGALDAQEQAPGKSYTPQEQAYHLISSNEIYDWVYEMSHPKYKGRLAGSPEYTQCAHWAALKFSAWGLQPGGDNGYYFQNFPVEYTDVTGAGTLSVQDGSGRSVFRIGLDYYPGTHTWGGTYKGGVVYAGFGLTAPEYGYDDYAGVDVRGKVVIIEPGVPCGKEEPEYAGWAGKYSGTAARMENACQHGAAGVLLLGRASHPGIAYHEHFIYAHITDNVANRLLEQEGKTAAQLREQIREQCAPFSFPVRGSELEMEFRSFHAPLSQTQNVIGYIPGSDPALKDSPIIIGAHLDHLGNPGVLFPGALDNASGSAIVMSVARAFAASGVKPVRPVVFILFGAEERGMTGSKFYIQNPLFPVEKTLCMFNLDMVGNGMSLRIGGVDSYPALKAKFAEKNREKLSRILYTSPYEKASGRMYTDGEIFNYNGVPAFSVGVRDKLGKTFYHVPEDTIETMTPEIMEDVAKLLYLTLCDISCDKKFKLK